MKHIIINTFGVFLGLTSQRVTIKENGAVIKEVAQAVLKTLSKKYLYNHRKITLESIIQRQVYRISGYFTDEKSYKPYVFRW